MSYIKNNGEAIGIPLLFLGCITLLVASILALMGTEVLYLIGLTLALWSVSLGLIAVGTAHKADERHTQLLWRIDTSIAWLPLMFNEDILSPSGSLIVKERASKQSEEAAQKRLDEDTKRAGYVRGEIYQTADGKWAIHWGGKYPL